jgi:hypothetical protein
VATKVSIRVVERPELQTDADGVEAVDDGFAEIGRRRVAEVVARVEALRVAGFGEQPFG